MASAAYKNPQGDYWHTSLSEEADPMRVVVAGFSRARRVRGPLAFFWPRKGALNRNQLKDKSLSDFRLGKLHGQVTAGLPGEGGAKTSQAESRARVARVQAAGACTVAPFPPLVGCFRVADPAKTGPTGDTATAAEARRPVLRVARFRK